MNQRILPKKYRDSGQGEVNKVIAKPATRVHIPELYRRPARDRDAQGCMKARA